MNNEIANILFIDSSVENYEFLINGVIKDIETIVIDSKRNGIEQITEILAQKGRLETLHIVSHGSPGCLYFGNSELNISNFEYYKQQLKNWSCQNLLIYGCNVARGDAGEEFVEKLHDFTGANIAASKTKTGNTELGGNWDLEVTKGDVKISLPFKSNTLKSFSQVLQVKILVQGFTESVYFDKLPSLPAELTIDQATGAIYLADRSMRGTLRKIASDKSISTVTKDFTTKDGFYPHMATDIHHSNGFVYSVLGKSNELVQIDTITGKTTTLTTFSKFGYHTGLDIKGNKVYVTDGTGSANELREYDLTTGKSSVVVSNIPSDVYSLEYDPVKNKVYFATKGNGFYEVNLADQTFKKISTAKSGIGNFAIDPSGEFIYVRERSEIRRISIANGSETTFMKVGDDRGDLAFGPSSSGSGRSLYVVYGRQILEVSGFTVPVSNQPVISDNFDSGNVNSNLWLDIQNGSPDSLPPGNSGKSLYFNGSSKRSATTVQMDVSNTSKISFELATGDRSKRIRGWDTPERGEEINFEYSVDGGQNWVKISSYGAGSLPWKNYDVLIPTAARTTSTQFRWIQYKNSGNNFDNWAIDDLVIGASNPNPNPTPTPTPTPTPGFSDNFDSGNVNSNLWLDIQNGSPDSLPPGNSGKSLYFNGSSKRSATTVQMDVSNTSKISFELATGDRSKRIRGWDTPERGEEINFEYSVDGGQNWVKISSYGAGALPWKNYDVLIPTAARTTSTQFRWIQYKNSGNNFDNWAIDDLVIGASNPNPNPTPTPTPTPTPGFSDNFDSGNVNSNLWLDIQNGSPDSLPPGNSGKSLYFNGSSKRSATTVQMDVSNTSKISFELATGDRSKRIRGWDTPERGEEINFEYSVDGGKNWVEITSYGAGALPWKNYDVLIPTAARTTSTQFRWIQYKNSGNNFDNWAIDDLVIGSTKVEANIAPIFTSNATLKAIEEDTINPEGETIANLFQGKFKDSNSGSSLSGIAVVENKTDSSNQGSWQYSLDGKRWLNIGYVNDSSSALALSANTKIRFSAVANYHGKPKSLGVRALDDTFNKAFTDSRNSQKINTINNGGTTAISAKITEINTTIKEVNDKPIASNDTYWIAEGSTLETASAITSLVMFSDKGNYVGQGKNYNFTPDTGEFYGSYTFNNGVSVSYRDSARGGSSWVLSFLAPYYTPLEAGKTYSNAIDFGLQDFNQAGLSVNGEGRANSKLTGEFFVNQIIYGVNNKVTSFDGSFEQLGQGDTGLLRGKIKYNATQNNLLPGILSNDSDIDSKSLTTILVSAPSNGNLKLNSNGAFTYIPTAGFKGIDKFTYRTSDGKTTSDIATVTLKVGVSDAPFITASQYSISYIQNADDILINSFTSISDSDSPDLDGGQLKVSISDSTEDERLLIRNQGTNPTEINLEGNTIKYGNYEIATFTGGTQSQDLVVTLNKNARTKQVETLLKNITYGNFSQNPVSEQRKIEISLTDGDGGTSNIISRTIDVKNINEIPEVAILQTNPNDITGKLINGDSLNNTLYGGSLNDFFNGKEGDDFLYGRDGDDTLLGGSNDDLLQGDQGNDRLFGGSGKDTFVLSKFTGTDTIYDFENGIDSLGLSQSLTFNDLNIQANGNNTDILFGNQVLATLRGINSSLIEQSDFTTV